MKSLTKLCIDTLHHMEVDTDRTTKVHKVFRADLTIAPNAAGKIISTKSYQIY
jgi:hypothetical protein